jgi:hypothetical protein
MTIRFRKSIITTILAAASVAAAGAAEQKTFATPTAAVKALVAAAQKGAREEVVAIIGEGIREALSTGNPAQDQVERAVLLKLAAEAAVAKPDEDTPGRYIMYLGTDEWPFPVPLIKAGAAWKFDTKAGLEEIEDRRIGRNEIGAMAACMTYVDAQLEYASGDRTGEGILQFAQKIRSTPGKYDGLFWSNDHGEDASPLGPFVANGAASEGGEPAPFFGYYYRILTAQGENATGGARNFLVDGHMLGGFALIAWPAEYGVSGVNSFIVSHLGQVYEKDLGSTTSEVVKGITRFDPDKSWKKSED